MGEYSEVQLTFSAGQARANRSRSRTKQEKEQETAAISGQKCSESSEKCSQPTFFTRMLLEVYPRFLTNNAAIWKVKAMKSGRQLYRLVPSVQNIVGKESGFWPTMLATDGRWITYYAKTHKSLHAAIHERCPCGAKNHRISANFAEHLMGYSRDYTLIT